MEGGVLAHLAGVLIMLDLVRGEGAATGSSFDFASGPIIPNALFPISVDGDLLREGVLHDGDFGGTMTAIAV